MVNRNFKILVRDMVRLPYPKQEQIEAQRKARNGEQSSLGTYGIKDPLANSKK